MRHVLFTDLGDVLIMADPGRAAAGLQKLLPALSAGEICTMLGSEEGAKIRHRFDCGMMTMNQYQHAVETLLGGKMDSQAFRKAHVSFLTPNMPVIQLWKKLRAGDRIEKLIAVSNTDPVRAGHAIILLGNANLRFDAIVASYAVGARKPDPIMFRTALNVAKARPEECIMVDDKLSNVESAQALGIAGIHYLSGHPRAQEFLISDLEKFSIRA